MDWKQLMKGIWIWVLNDGKEVSGYSECRSLNGVKKFGVELTWLQIDKVEGLFCYNPWWGQRALNDFPGFHVFFSNFSMGWNHTRKFFRQKLFQKLSKFCDSSSSLLSQWVHLYSAIFIYLWSGGHQNVNILWHPSCTIIYEEIWPCRYNSDFSRWVFEIS